VLTAHAKGITINDQREKEGVVVGNRHRVQHREGRAMKSKRGIYAPLLLWSPALLLAAPPGGIMAQGQDSGGQPIAPGGKTPWPISKKRRKDESSGICR
jgi:hypothetical protein